MARMPNKKRPARPAPQFLDAIVFPVAMQTGDVEVIGIPFEHRGRTWAVHGIVGLSITDSPCYTVSDVLSGKHVPKSEAKTIDASRAAAIAAIDAVTNERWADTFDTTRTASDE